MVGIVTDKISIIVVTYNSLPALQDCLVHLLKIVENLENEIIIVDNNSSDHSPSVAKNICPQSNIIVNKSNLGFAAACNRGAKKATGNYLLFLNPDVYLDINAVSEIVNFYQAQERIGVAVGRLRFPDASFQPTCRKLPTVGNMIFSRGAFLSRILGVSDKYTLPDYAVPTEIPAAAGTFMMISSELFQKIGRFDERFFMYMEDTDLCKRLIMLGFRNFFLPSAQGVHEWGEGSSAGTLKRSWHQHKSVHKYFMKHKRDWTVRLVLPVLLLVNFSIVGIFDIIRRLFGK